MAFLERKPRKWGDRRDGVWVKDATPLSLIMANLFPKRTESEVYLHQELDVTELLRYINEKNTPDAPFKTTFFHCFVAMTARLVNERPYLNRFVQGGRIYERDQITVSFVAKRRFTDHSEEALMTYRAKGTDKLYDISRRIVGDVHEMREKSDGYGIDDVLKAVAKLPRPLLMLVVRLVRFLDFWGKVPKFLTEGDSNYASVLLSNLGSIKCPAVYHHLNNYGTTSVMITIGTIHKAPVYHEDGTMEMRDVVDIGATLDERIGDGFYFARSLKLFQHMAKNPYLLDEALEVDSNYDYK